MIQSFSCQNTQLLYEGKRVARSVNFAASAERKLQMLDAVAELTDLRSPPGSRLEALEGDRQGQHSIRINQQWRICFICTENGPAKVEIVDYR